MKSEHKFHALNGCKNVSRHELEGIINLAKIENNSDVVFRLSKVLNDQPQEQYFNIAVVSYPDSGLNGAKHTGDYKEALDDCGRLRKGFHFVGGKVVKVEAKKPNDQKKTKETTKPTPKTAVEKATTTKNQVVKKKPNDQRKTNKTEIQKANDKIGKKEKSDNSREVAVANPKDEGNISLSENKTTNIIPNKEIEVKKEVKPTPVKEKKEIKTTNFEQKYKVSFADLVDFLSAGSMDLPMIYNNYEFATIEPNYTQFATDFLNHKYYNNIKVSGKGYAIFEYDSKESLTIPVEKLEHFAVKTPSKKDFIDNLKNIVGKDKLRPVMTEIFVDKDYYVATDTHVLVCLSNAANTTEVGKIINLDLEKSYKDYIKTFGSVKPELSKTEYFAKYKYIDGKYPNYEAVIPNYKNFTPLQDINYWITICENFLKYTQAEKGLINTLVIGTPENEVILNIKMALRVFKSLAENGNQKIKIGYSATNKAIIAKTETKDFGLIMPIQKLDTKFITSERINLPDGFNENGLSGPGLNSLFKNEGLKATASNPAWFPKYKQFKNKPKQAIQHLMRVKKGDCISALYREDIGYIDIVWGENDSNNKGFGLKHIIEKHGKEIAELGFKVEDFISIIVQFGEFKIAEKTDKIYLEGKMFRMVLSKTNDKTFVLSAFDLRPMWKKEKSKGLNGTYDGINFMDFPLQNPTLNFSKKLRKTNKSVYGNGFNMPPLYSKTSISKNKVTKTIPKSKKPLKGVGLISNIIGNVVASSVLGNPAKTSIAAQMKQRANTKQEYYIVPDRDIANFLGKIEKKTKESVAITLTGGQGSMKTRLCFQLMNTLAQNYKVGHASIEEHPHSTLYYDKVHQYLNNKAMHNVSAPEINSIDDVHKLCRENDVIVIDSFSKLQEMQRGCELDKDFRKRYDGKLFIIIYQLTSDGKMRGGAKSQFDGDIIGFIKKEPNYKENYCYWDKNRYQSKNLEDLKFNIYQGKLIGNQEPEAENNLEFSFNVK